MAGHAPGSWEGPGGNLHQLQGNTQGEGNVRRAGTDGWLCSEKVLKGNKHNLPLSGRLLWWEGMQKN